MSKFILKKDWILKYTILDKQGQELLYTKGKIFEPNEHGEYVISSTQGKMILKYKDMKSAVDGEDLLFEEIMEIPEIKVTLIEEEEEDIIKNYRLQLDVKTTSRKAKEIENYLRKTLQEML
jgi:hypothetical protein